MIFPNRMYIEENIDENIEKRLIRYAELYVQFLIIEKECHKRNSSENRQKYIAVRKNLMNHASQIKDISISEIEANIYLLIAAAKKKRVDVLYKFVDNVSAIDENFRKWSTAIEDRMRLSRENQQKYGNIESKIQNSKKALYKEIDNIINIFQPEHNKKLLKRCFVFNSWSKQVILTSVLEESYFYRNKKNFKFSEVLVKELLEKLAAVYLNLKAEIFVLEKTTDKLIADINGTVCKLSVIRKERIEFKHSEDEKFIKTFKGDAKTLTENRLLQCYAIFLNDIYANNLRAKFICSEEKDKRIIDEKDIIVKSNIRYCENKKHEVIDVIAKLQVRKKDGAIVWNYLHAAYCKDCNRYYILSEDYKKLEGIPICTVIEIKKGKEVIIHTPDKQYKRFDSESLIHSYGYNVNINENLSSDYRRSILVKLITEKIVSQEIILSYLDSLIEKGLGSPKYENAVKKWKSDREYIAQLWYGNKIVEVNNITKII